MDTFISLPNSKSQKLLKDQHASGGDDIISKSSDNILLYILSFLPISDVLRTSALSKRWKYLWANIFDIDFDETSYTLVSGMETSFLESVERLLVRRDSSHIRKFRLILYTSVSASRVISWVFAALLYKVEEVELSLPYKTLFLLPNALFTSESLNILKLEMSIFKVPSLIRLSNLKALHLTVTFPSDESTERLFSGCPVLQDLVLYNCSWQHNKRIILSIPTLRTLTIYYCPSFPDKLLDCVITICAENLMSFECSSYLIFELVLCNLSSLANAYIDVTILSCKRREFPQRAIKLLGGIYNVKSLTLWNNTLECLLLEQNPAACLPTFHNLTHLRMPWWGMSDSDYTTEVLMHFLQKSPNLEYLEIPGEFDPECEWSNIVPQCFKFCLKTIRILYLEGNDTELIWLKYLLGNTNVLGRVTMFCSEGLRADLEKQKKINSEKSLSFECTSYLIFELVFCNLSSPANAYIDVTFLASKRPEFPQSAIKLLGGIHTVNLLLCGIIPLRNLTQNMSGPKLDLNVLSFAVKLLGSYIFEGNDTEVIWLKYFLGNTNVLERVTMVCSESLQ